MEFVNLTPHEIRLNDGRSFPPSGTVARVQQNFFNLDQDICQAEFGEVEGLPEPRPDVMLIVSAMVLAATARDDVVAPATGHPECIRNERGHIVSVPCFIQ